MSALLIEREKTHGNFLDNAFVAQRIKEAMRSGKNWNAVLSSTQRESLELIATKIGRVLAGDPNHADTWRDISGYALLCAGEGKLCNHFAPYGDGCGEALCCLPLGHDGPHSPK